jgi:hypothetical protein
MLNSHNEISNYSLKSILRIGFLLFMSIYISIGYLIRNLDHFEANEIELNEGNELENEKEENTKEAENDEFLDHLFSHNFYFQEKYHSLLVSCWKWNPIHGEIPTPPPKYSIA